LASYSSILKLVWPLALGMINNAVMQFVDRAYLAQDSMSALEAVLPAGVLAWIFMGFFQSVVGFSGVFVAQFHGAGKPTKCRSAYHAAVFLSVLSGLLMVPCLPLGDWILAKTAPAPELLSLERVYYDSVILGGFFVYALMAASSYFTGLGCTRIVFWVNVIGNVINIALDPVLIFGIDWSISFSSSTSFLHLHLPHLGIAGAAYATVFSVAVQAVALLVAAHRHLRAAERDAFSWELVRRILRFGIPAGLYEILTMASFAIFVFVTGGVGDVALAASNACFSVNYLLFAPMTGFALGVQTLVGQARGRGDDGEASLALRRTLVLALGFVALAGGLMLVFHRPILSLFAPADVTVAADFHALGKTLFLLMSAWMFFDAADVVISGALKGAGDTKFVMVWMLFCSFILWLPPVFVVRHFHNTMPALWCTMVWDVVILCIGVLFRWWRGRWKQVRIV